MPSIAYVVARSYPQNVIGCENRLPWVLKTDMEFFRKVTQGHAIIMGRKTFDSIGRPLKNRMNIIVSRKDGNDGNNLRWVKNREAALFFADFFSIINDKPQLMVIGGQEIYEQFSGLVNKVFLTEVFHSFENGDAFFGTNFDRRQWKTVAEHDYNASDHDQYPFRISVLEKRIATIRQRDLKDFLVSDIASSEWLSSRVIEKAAAFDKIPEEQFELPVG